MTSRESLHPRVETYAAQKRLPGLRSKLSVSRFEDELRRSLARLRAFQKQRFSGTANPRDARFHPYQAIVERLSEGDKEEAIWLSFLVTACGMLDHGDAWCSVRSLYGAFGDGEPWTWVRIRTNPALFRAWLLQHRAEVRGLEFGNHRKFETRDPMKAGNIGDIVESYVAWVEGEGRGSQAAIFEEAVRSAAPGPSFEMLYRRIEVKRFGRTAKFDWLCLLGNLGIFPIAPAKCYLRGSSGPLTGALRLFGGGEGRRSIEELEREATELARAVGVPIEAIEDTLCNWQKTRKDVPGGWISAACAPGGLPTSQSLRTCSGAVARDGHSGHHGEA